MFSIRSIAFFALTALAGVVVSSPTGETTAAAAASVPALAGILTTARAQLFAVQTDVSHAILSGNVKDANSANVYVDKMASIVSDAKASFDASKDQAPNTVLSGSATDDLVDSLEVLLADLVKVVNEVLKALLGSVPTGSREAVVSHTSATLDDPLSGLLSSVGSILQQLLSAVEKLLAGILGSLSGNGLPNTSSVLSSSL